MKEIKQYLRNQKDLYTMMFTQELQSDSINLAQAKVWLDRLVILDEELQQLEKHGK
jgi:hypothetical protein